MWWGKRLRLLTRLAAPMRGFVNPFRTPANRIHKTVTPFPKLVDRIPVPADRSCEPAAAFHRSMDWLPECMNPLRKRADRSLSPINPTAGPANPILEPVNRFLQPMNPLCKPLDSFQRRNAIPVAGSVVF
jgi:hypothetical protein